MKKSELKKLIKEELENNPIHSYNGRLGIFDDIDKDLEWEGDKLGYLKAVIAYCEGLIE